MKIALKRVRGLRGALSSTMGSSADDDDGCTFAESESDRRQRYLDSELREVSDAEFWQEVRRHHEPFVTEHDDAPREQPTVLANQSSPEMVDAMRNANRVIDSGLQRLRDEFDYAENMNDYDAMELLDLRIRELEVQRFNVRG